VKRSYAFCNSPAGQCAIAVALVVVYCALFIHLYTTDGFRDARSIGFDYIGFMAFACVALSFIPMFYVRRGSRLAIVTALVILYVGSYVVLSSIGEYRASISGRVRCQSTGMGLHDAGIWEPKGVYWDPYLDVSGRRTNRATLLGWFYSPLVALDRRWVHPTHYMFEQREE
jgi:hypothetical protein